MLLAAVVVAAQGWAAVPATGCGFTYGGKRYDAGAFAKGAAVELGGGVRVTLERHEWPEADAAEWLMWFENTGTEPSAIFEAIDDGDFTRAFPGADRGRPGYMLAAGDLRLRTMKGMVPGKFYWEDDRVSAQEYEFRDIYLKNGKKETVCNENGRSSEGMMPFFNLGHTGGGVMIAIGWTGAWRLSVARGGDTVRVKIGIGKARFYLKPGEKVRTSSVLVMDYAAGEDADNKFRRLIRDHYSHAARTACKRQGLMGFLLWGGLTSDEMIRRVDALKACGIRFDDLWIDAGWYGQCKNCDNEFTGDWWRFTGDWEVNTRVHPDGFTNVVRAANAAGMNLMLWFEPERVADGAKAKRAQKGMLKDNILWLGTPEARETMFATIDDYATRLKMSCYRQDFNTALMPVWQRHDEKDREGMCEIKHIMGLYEVWDRLLAAHPGLVIDNCSSGGRRIDIETLKRSIPFFRSDYLCNFNGAAEVVQAHNMISTWLPYNGAATRTCLDTYRARSSYSSSWGMMGFGTMFDKMDADGFRWLKERADEYRLIRDRMTGDFYNHGSRTADPAAWAIWQYHDPATGKGVVLAFRRAAAPSETATIELKGIVPEKSLAFRNLDGLPITATGRTLTLRLPDTRTSTIVVYE